MQITVEYAAQVKRAAGVASETIDIDESASLSDLVTQIVANRDEALRTVLLDGESNIHRSILVFVDDEQVRESDAVKLTDGQTVTFLSPISGG